MVVVGVFIITWVWLGGLVVIIYLHSPSVNHVFSFVWIRAKFAAEICLRLADLRMMGCMCIYGSYVWTLKSAGI